MEIIALILSAIFGFVIFRNKPNTAAEIAAKLEKDKQIDNEIKLQQQAIDDAIKTLDEGIEKMKREREANLKEKSLTLKERADRIKKGLQ